LEDSNLGLKTCTRWTQGGLELALDNNLPEQGGSKFKIVNDADLLMAGGLVLQDIIIQVVLNLLMEEMLFQVL